MPGISGLKTYLKRWPAAHRYARSLRSALEAIGSSESSLESAAEAIELLLGRPDAERELFRLLRARGIYLLRDHYYRPFTDPRKLPAGYFSTRSRMVGVAIDPSRCFDLRSEERRVGKEWRSG